MTIDKISYQWRRNLRPEQVTENKEDILLILLDPNLEDNEVFLQMQIKLIECNPACQFYTDVERCINLLESIKNEYIFLIISDRIAQTILPKVRSYYAIKTIFIFSFDQQNDVSLLSDDNRIVELCTNIENLIESIQNKLHLVRKQYFGFTLFDQKQKSIRDLSKDSASFLWYQLLIHILKELPQDDKSKEDMLDKCIDYYRANRREMEKIQQYRYIYKPEDAIEWYTDECFLYKLLNKALRTEDFQLLYAFRSFIVDLITQLEKQSLKRKDDTTVILYRGQQLSVEELEKIKENIGKLISINGFFSTSRNIEVALAYAGKCRTSNYLQSILFQVEVDPCLSSVIFADISNQSRMRDEQEVLFTLNALFKLVSVEFDSKLDVWKVLLVATGDTSRNSQEYLAALKYQMTEYTPIIYFGRLLLIEMGQIDRAAEYFNALIQSLPPNHPDISAVYNGMGHVYCAKNDLHEALNCFQLAYKLRQKQLPPNHPHIASSLDNIGNIYRQKGDFDKALEYYRQAEAMIQQIYPNDHVRKARSMKNIGSMYQNQRDFDTAQTYLFNALEMYNRVLPVQHPEIAKCFSSIASFYHDKSEVNHALDYYVRELMMEEQCLPTDHPNIYECIGRIVDIYKKMNNVDKALEFCLEKFNMQQNTLGKTHPSISRTMMIIADLLEYKNENKALEYYQQSLFILENSPNVDERAIAKCLVRMACLFQKCNMLNDALQVNVKLVKLHRRMLPFNSADLADGLRNLGLSYQAIKNIPDSNRCFHESLSIYRITYDEQHPYITQLEAEISKNEHDIEQVE